MRALVTGVAGFIGSTVAERLLREGHDVLGVDCLSDFYAVDLKLANLRVLNEWAEFSCSDADLRDADVRELVHDVDVVFHLAAQPGVRPSWAEGFPVYTDNNILVTQRLLEAARDAALERFVFASSSSVYGNGVAYPTIEAALPRPNSPYGVTKLAAEHLCGLYAANWGVPTVALRYFTVYGPRQRPDMAIHRLIAAGLAGGAFPLYGDGGQVRDFTFVEDVASATIAAATAPMSPGETMNVAGGSSISMADLVRLVGEVLECDIDIDVHPDQPGDVRATKGAIERAHRLLGWQPVTSLREGIEAQVAWHRSWQQAGR